MSPVTHTHTLCSLQAKGHWEIIPHPCRDALSTVSSEEAGQMDGYKEDIRFPLFGLSPLATHSFNEAAIKGLHAFEGSERELSAIFRGLKIKQSHTF